jgi:hypothetical protein
MAPSEMIFHRRVRVLEHAAVTTVEETTGEGVIEF